MTVAEIVATASTAGIWLQARGDQLHVEAPRGALTPDLRTAMVARKPDLLAVLGRLQEMRRLAVEAPRPVVYARESARGGPGWYTGIPSPSRRPCDATLSSRGE